MQLLEQIDLKDIGNVSLRKVFEDQPVLTQSQTKKKSNKQVDLTLDKINEC